MGRGTGATPHSDRGWRDWRDLLEEILERHGDLSEPSAQPRPGSRRRQRDRQRGPSPSARALGSMHTHVTPGPIGYCAGDERPTSVARRIGRSADGAHGPGPYGRPMTPIGRRRDDSPILCATAPAGPGWVHATVARRTYRRRLGFVEYDVALSAEGSVLVLISGWRFVGLRRLPPLVDFVEEGWLRRPAALHPGGGTSLVGARSAVA